MCSTANAPTLGCASSSRRPRPRHVVRSVTARRRRPAGGSSTSVCSRRWASRWISGGNGACGAARHRAVAARLSNRARRSRPSSGAHRIAGASLFRLGSYPQAAGSLPISGPCSSSTAVVLASSSSLSAPGCHGVDSSRAPVSSHSSTATNALPRGL